MPRIRPLSPGGPVRISDIGAHLLAMGLPGRPCARRPGSAQALDFAVPARVLADLNRLVEPTPPLVVPLGSMREPRCEVVLTIAMECAQATRSHEIPGGALHQITEIYPDAQVVTLG